MKTETEVNAEKLYLFLKQNGPQWEDNCLNFLFPPVVFSQNTKKEYYEHQTKVTGCPQVFSIDGKIIETEKIPYIDTYQHKLSEAYQYLRKAGKAGERNNGYNSYVFFAK